MVLSCFIWQIKWHGEAWLRQFFTKVSCCTSFSSLDNDIEHNMHPFKSYTKLKLVSSAIIQCALPNCQAFVSCKFAPVCRTHNLTIDQSQPSKDYQWANWPIRTLLSELDPVTAIPQSPAHVNDAGRMRSIVKLK